MQMVDDVTWAGLDPNAGAFTARQRGRAALAIGAAALVVVLVWIVWWSGVISPRLGLEDVSDGSPGQRIGKSRTFRYSVMLVNHGQRDLNVVSVGRSGPGLKLVSVTGAGSPLPGSSSQRIDLTYEVTDCGLVTHDEWPIPVTIQRHGGPGVLLLTAPPIDPFWLDGSSVADGSGDDAGVDAATVDSSFGDMSDGLSSGGSDELGGEPWQGALAGLVCSSPDRAGDQ